MEQLKHINLNYRLYSFVANHYISPLQCGLQTAHVVSNLSSFNNPIYKQWATQDKTIIICGAGNYKGVVDCYVNLRCLIANLPVTFFHEDEELRVTIFHEDIDSMNGMATACGVIVPNIFFDAVYTEIEGSAACYIYTDKDTGDYLTFAEDSPEGQFIKHIKSYRLA